MPLCLWCVPGSEPALRGPEWALTLLLLCRLSPSITGIGIPSGKERKSSQLVYFQGHLELCYSKEIFLGFILCSQAH